MTEVNHSDYVKQLLTAMHKKGGSDLFVTAGAPPSIKLNGKMTPLTDQKLSPEQSRQLVHSIMNDKQKAEYDKNWELNFSLSVPGVARFRVNAYIQRGTSGMVLRMINNHIPTLDELNLPKVLENISMTNRGLVIFVGATGSGKSTSLASMIDYRNEHSEGHIITIEDPIEYIHHHKNCIVIQREVGVDTQNFEVALKNTLRQAPDVILIGEIRDRETMEHAIAFAETGHLCLATLHANNANQALDRIINFFPEDRRHQLLMDLSLNLKAIVSQRLIRKESGNGQIPAVEVMMNSPLISDLIFKGDVHAIKEVMKRSKELGMQTFDQSLLELYERHMIDFNEALRNADSENDLRIEIKLKSERGLPKETEHGSELRIED